MSANDKMLLSPPNPSIKAMIVPWTLVTTGRPFAAASDGQALVPGAFHDRLSGRRGEPQAGWDLPGTLTNVLPAPGRRSAGFCEGALRVSGMGWPGYRN